MKHNCSYFTVKTASVHTLRQALAQAPESEFFPFLELVLVLIDVRFLFVNLTYACVCAHACACFANENQALRHW